MCWSVSLKLSSKRSKSVLLCVRVKGQRQGVSSDVVLIDKKKEKKKIESCWLGVVTGYVLTRGEMDHEMH